MPIVQPAKERHTIQDNGSSLQIVILSRKNYFILFFMGFWLLGWAVGEIMVGGIVIAGILQLFLNTSELAKIGLAGLSGGGLFLLLWLILWTAGGVFALYTFFWQLVGKENIEISHDAIKIQRSVFGLGQIKEYVATHIKDFRVSPIPIDNSMFGWSRASHLWGISGGYLAFDYGARTYRFGSGIDEAEAKQIYEKNSCTIPAIRK